MELTPCPACGRRIAKTALVCPGCGFGTKHTCGGCQYFMEADEDCGYSHDYCALTHEHISSSMSSCVSYKKYVDWDY